MNFLALQLFDEETKQPLRVSVNPHYVVTVLAYVVEDKYVISHNLDDPDPTFTEVPAVSITFELHDDAQLLIACLHKDGWSPEQLFDDIRNKMDHNDEE